MDQKSTLFSWRRFLMVAVLILMGTTGAFAQDFFFFHDYTGDHLWSNPENWYEGLKPNEMFSEVTIYADVIVDEDVSIGTLNNAGNHTLTVLSGNMLIVNVAIDWGDNDFILEDKAELVYRDPLKVMIKKSISAYDEHGHLWNLIASPVRENIVPSMENGFLTDPETGYALYSFNENTANWINFKETPFALENGKSYLYANALDTTLLFEGTTVGYSAQCTLSYHTENGAYAGYNFIGNPLPCYAFLNRSYYILSEESNSLIAVANSATKSIAPSTGIILNSEGPDDNNILFSHMPFFQYLGYQGFIEITVAKSDAPSMVLDQALLSFNEGDDLTKISLFEDAPRVYFTKNNKDLAIFSVDSVEVQPLRFKTLENGSYTMHVEPKGREIEYLHLIDNISGTNVDLLASPDYSFSATTNDYASRFKLVFDPHYGIGEDGPSTGSGTSGTFAYYSDGNIVINDVETCHGASLQIVNMTGRVIVCRDVACRVSTIGMTPGVYVLRLITANGVKTQKIMIQ